jgi:hypothetical protein
VKNLTDEGALETLLQAVRCAYFHYPQSDADARAAIEYLRARLDERLFTQAEVDHQVWEALLAEDL